MTITLEHLGLLSIAAERALNALAEWDPIERECTEAGLLQWDAGRTPGHHLRGGSRRVRHPGVYITPAGLACLAAFELGKQSLDGTAPPSKLPKPGAQKVAEGDT